VPRSIDRAVSDNSTSTSEPPEKPIRSLTQTAQVLVQHFLDQMPGDTKRAASGQVSMPMWASTQSESDVAGRRTKIASAPIQLNDPFPE
jgi:hypothetical protein